MNRSDRNRTKEEGKITMDDIRAHLARFGRDIPHALPMVSLMEEPKEEKKEKPEKPKENIPPVGPLNTSGLMEALIHRPRDVNSPY